MKFYQVLALSFGLLALGFEAGFIFGERRITNAYDVSVLEQNTLELVANEHLNGCILGTARVYREECTGPNESRGCGNLGPFYDACDAETRDVYETWRVSWHNVIWKRKSR